MSLQTWLEEKAGLRGKRLDVAFTACEKEMIESKEDLMKVMKAGNLAKVFPQTLLESVVQTALEQDAESAVVQNKQASTKKVAITNLTSSKAPQEHKHTDLPAAKEYAAFISHKKVLFVYHLYFQIIN